jgi:hypothetical protein
VICPQNIDLYRDRDYNPRHCPSRARRRRIGSPVELRGGFGESRAAHARMSPLADGHLWLSDIRGDAVHGIDDGRVSVVHRFVGGEEPAGLGWPPNGDLLVAGMARCLIYRMFDGRAAVHADLTQLAPHQINDMIVWFGAMLFEAVICVRPQNPSALSVDQYWASLGTVWARRSVYSTGSRSGTTSSCEIPKAAYCFASAKKASGSSMTGPV